MPGEMLWSVTARHWTGDSRSGWDPGSPGFTTDARFWNAAEQVKTGHSEFGEHGMMTESGIIPVTLVYPSGQTTRDTQTCFKVPENTIGVWWWFGPVSQVGSMPFEEIVQVTVAPGDFEVCTTRLDLSGDEPMVLVVYPYSNFRLGNPQNTFAAPTAFMMKETTCGAVGNPCCSPGDSCVEGALCQGGHCVSCGGMNEPCCDGRCDPGNHDDSKECVNGVCRRCGQRENDPCCGFYSSPNHYCEGTLNCIGETTCKKCGEDEGDPCCRNYSTPEVGHCWNSLVCNESADRCEPQAKCNVPVPYEGTNTPMTYDIDVGENDGRVDLFFNTYGVPDNITVSYEDEELRSTGCVGTTGTRPNLDPKPGCNNPGGICCDYEGNCRMTVGYGPGRSRVLTISVDPDCGPPGETAWTFTLGCPY
jgi:hypothetical protein